MTLSQARPSEMAPKIHKQQEKKIDQNYRITKQREVSEKGVSNKGVLIGVSIAAT